MTETLACTVRSGFYLDSVALMRLSAELSATDGVREAVMMTGTPMNLALLADAGLVPRGDVDAGPNDLVIAIRATSDAAASKAMAQAAVLLDTKSATASPDHAARPRTLKRAAEDMGDANLALISTPGMYAVREAREAIGAGLNVMMFSDNVPLDAERQLKEMAHARSLLVMGPDCGTAYLHGVPLAFANAVRHGRIGVVSASGTGLQEFAVLLDTLSAGVSHGIGVGGRDLDDAVGGISTLDAIDLLAHDPDTDHIVLIAKPGGINTVPQVFDRLANTGKPATAMVFGNQGAIPIGDNVTYVTTLRDAALRATGRTALVASSDVTEEIATLLPRGSNARRVKGLYTGGTLATEAAALLGASTIAGADVEVIDFGADEHTVGRPHPMIDPTARTEALTQALGDDSVAVILVDIVLGYGAHHDPAAPVAAAIAEAASMTSTPRPPVVARIVGTASDPQNAVAQANCLIEVGAFVAPSHADAVDLAIRIATRA